jgi:hypothetical protein
MARGLTGRLSVLTAVSAALSCNREGGRKGSMIHIRGWRRVFRFKGKMGVEQIQG